MVIAHNQPLGKAVRWPLRLIPKTAVMPILSGPNRGLKWTAGSSIHGCWLGWYEKEQAQLLCGLCQPHMNVFDVGANAGFFTLLFARRARHVIAFEPDPDNFANLRQHVALNGLVNVGCVAAAAASKAGQGCFAPNDTMGRLSDNGTLNVTTVRLDDYETPDLIKMDIEGGEAVALEGAQRILAERRTVWFVELHGEPGDTCRRHLVEAGYHVAYAGANHITAKPS